MKSNFFRLSKFHPIPAGRHDITEFLELLHSKRFLFETRVEIEIRFATGDVVFIFSSLLFTSV